MPAPSNPLKSDTPRAFWPFLLAISAIAGLAELAFIIVNVSALPIYLKIGLGLPNLPGIALAIFYLVEAVGNSPMGTLADRVGRRRIMVTGALISVFTCLVTAFIRVPTGGGPGAWIAIGAILAMRALDGLGAAMLWPAVFASVGDRVAEGKQAQAMGLLNITYLLGIAFGPLVGGHVNDTFGAGMAVTDPRRYAPSFFVAALCFLATAVLAYFAAPRRSEMHAVSQHPLSSEAEQTATPDLAPHAPVEMNAIRKAIRDVPMLMVLGFITFFGVGLIAPYVKPFFMARFDLSESAFGTLLLYPALIIAAVSVPLGKLSDVWGKTRSIHLGLGLCALAVWLILWLDKEWAVVVLGSLLGIGFVLAFPAYMAYLSDLTGPRERGGMIGAVRMAQGVGALIGAALASPLYTLDAQHLTVFAAAGVLLTLGFFLSLFFIRERPLLAPPAA